MRYYTVKTKSKIKKENLNALLEILAKNIKEFRKDFDVVNILKIGSLSNGEAYYHEADQYYNLSIYQERCPVCGIQLISCDCIDEE